MAVIRSRRVRDAGMGGLVQQPAWSPSATSRRPKPRNAITPCWNTLPWRRDSNQMASDEPGAVHLGRIVLARRPSDVLNNLLSWFLRCSGLLSHLRSCERYDEPETLPYSIHPVCPMSADGGHGRRCSVTIKVTRSNKGKRNLGQLAGLLLRTLVLYTLP